MTVTVYANACVTTFDPRRPAAEAVAVRGERVVATGTTAECREAATAAAGGGAVTEVDLGGAHVVPGLTDCHIHLEQYARERRILDLRTAADLPEAQRRLRAHTAGPATTSWVLGGRHDEHRWRLGRSVHRRDLDAVCPDRPVALHSHDGHSLWLNTAGLAALGIDAHTPDPPGGRIERDADGPTGVLRETAAQQARATATASDTTPLRDDLRGAFTDLLAVGITSIHDIDGADAVDAFRELRRAAELPVRVHQVLPRTLLPTAIDRGWHTGAGDTWLRTGPVKLFADGALGSRTAAMSEPYPEHGGSCDHGPAAGDRGITVLGRDALTALVGEAARAGIAAAVHAIGDAANTAVLDAVAAVRATGAGAALRHRIEHAQLVAPADVERFAALGVTASMQPIHCTSDIALAGDLLAGRDLAGYAWQDLSGAGAHVAFGSDAPVETFDPVAGIQAATTRRDPATGRTSPCPPNAVTARHAVRCYTVEAAYASGEEHVKGRLAPGHLADFAVFDGDLCDPDTAAAGTARAQATVVGGTVRWQRGADGTAR